MEETRILRIPGPKDILQDSELNRIVRIMTMVGDHVRFVVLRAKGFVYKLPLNGRLQVRCHFYSHLEEEGSERIRQREG